MNRRGFLQAILAAGIAPAIVKAANIMPIFSRGESGLLVPDNRILTIEEITREALAILENNLLEFGYNREERIGNFVSVKVHRSPWSRPLRPHTNLTA